MPSYIEGVTFSGVVETLRWGDFIALVNAKQLSLEYAQSTDSYTIWAVDGPITYTCQLVFSSASAGYPFPMSDGYTKAQNDTDVGTFTGTYQSTANLNANSPYGALGGTAPITGALLGGVDTAGKLRAPGIVLASTAAVATQQGAVVALHPTSPLPAGSNALGSVTVTGSVAVTGTFWQTTQPVSGTVTSNQGGAPWTVTGTGTTGSPATGILTIQGNASGVAVPISAASLPLPTGAATQTTLASILTNTPALGQAVMASSSPVVIASNQSAIPVTLTSTTITGTVAVTQSTSPWVVQDAADGSVAAGAAGTKSQLGGLVYNSSAPSLTNGQQVALQGDSSGNLLVNVKAGTISATNPSVGTVGSTAPTSDTQIGGISTAGNLITPGVTLASTAAVATQQALVVTLSPSSVALNVTMAAPSGSSPNLAFGDVVLASSTVTSAVRRTTYTEQSANFAGSIKSSSTSDASAGTGAQTITIYYVDSTGATAASATFTLNGTTAVNLSTANMCFIEKIVVATVGSNGSNVGVITLYAGTGGTGTVIGTINAGDNRTFWCHHYVVTGKTCNITDFSLGNNSAAGGAVGFLRAKTIGTSAPELQVGDSLTSGAVSNAVVRPYSSTVQVPGPSRITAYTLPNTTASYTYRASFNSYDQ